MENFCTYSDGREAQLVSYLYGEMTADERHEFSRHLSGCVACRAELGALEELRGDLATWSAPEVVGDIAVRTVAPAPVVAMPVAKRAWRPWREIPMWAQTAAAILVLGVAAGFANLDITYGSGGFTVRTGWNHAAAPAAPATAAAATTATASVPSRAEFDALAAAVRAGAAARPQTTATSASPASASDDELLRRVKALVQDSEQRQQRELALRVAEVVREGQVQRQADLEKIDRSLGMIQRNASVESMRTQQYFNSLAQRVSQTTGP